MAPKVFLVMPEKLEPIILHTYYISFSASQPRSMENAPYIMQKLLHVQHVGKNMNIH